MLKIRAAFVFLLVLRSVAPHLAGAQASTATRLVGHRYTGANTADPLGFVKAALFARDSSVVILDSENARVHQVRAGKRMAVFGRTGSGPGELRALTAMGSIRDSIWISDSQLRRVTVFPLAGAGRGHRQAAIASLGDGAFTTLYGYDGTRALLQGVTHVRAFNGTTMERAALYVRDVREPSGRAADKQLVALSPSVRQMSVPVRINGQPFNAAAAQPFDAVPQWSAARSEVGAVVVDVAEPGAARVSIRVRQWRADGTIARTCSMVRDARLLTPRMVEAEMRRIVVPGRSAERLEPDWEAFKAAIARPRFVPPVRSVLLASDGTVWIRTDASFATAREEYVVLGVAGCAVQRAVALPVGTLVQDARGELIVTSSYVDDEPAVDVWRTTPLQKRPTSPDSDGI